jgi:hypothetical protein
LGGGEVPKKPKKKKIVGVGEAAVAFCFAGGFGLLDGSYTHRKQVYWVVDYSFLDSLRTLIRSP